MALHKDFLALLRAILDPERIVAAADRGMSGCTHADHKH